jgi:hypothetical protein
MVIASARCGKTTLPKSEFSLGGGQSRTKLVRNAQGPPDNDSSRGEPVRSNMVPFRSYSITTTSPCCPELEYRLQMTGAAGLTAAAERPLISLASMLSAAVVLLTVSTVMGASSDLGGPCGHQRAKGQQRKNNGNKRERFHCKASLGEIALRSNTEDRLMFPYRNH